MNRRPKIAVLLSTYNGRKYISELLESVQRQQSVQIEVYIRDDGSTDGTISFLRSYVDEHPNCHLALGSNVGVTASFYRLLAEAGEADYYAICDQDDRWLPDKLERAVDFLDRATAIAPTLYGSPVTPVDANLRPIRNRSRNTIKPSLENAIVENIIPGCTMVLNSKARDILLTPWPEPLRMYDWWIYQVIAATGTVFRDSESRILYRQHANNTVGSADGAKLWLRRIQRRRPLLSGQAAPTLHARELLRLHGKDMDFSSLSIVTSFLSHRDSFALRLSYAWLGPWRRSRPLDNFVFRILYLFGRV